jgi:hypothetical protein
MPIAEMAVVSARVWRSGGQSSRAKRPSFRERVAGDVATGLELEGLAGSARGLGEVRGALVGVQIRSEAVLLIGQVGLEDRSQHQGGRCLHHSVPNRRDTEVNSKEVQESKGTPTGGKP